MRQPSWDTFYGDINRPVTLKLHDSDVYQELTSGSGLGYL